MSSPTKCVFCQAPLQEEWVACPQCGQRIPPILAEKELSEIPYAKKAQVELATRSRSDRLSLGIALLAGGILLAVAGWFGLPKMDSQGASFEFQFWACVTVVGLVLTLCIAGSIVTTTSQHPSSVWVSVASWLATGMAIAIGSIVLALAFLIFLLVSCLKLMGTR